jgi:hypothetical protein
MVVGWRGKNRKHFRGKVTEPGAGAREVPCSGQRQLTTP